MAATLRYIPKWVEVEGGDFDFTKEGDWLIEDKATNRKPEEIDWAVQVTEFLEDKDLSQSMKDGLVGMSDQVEALYNELMAQNCPTEVARDLCFIKLYDVVVLLDDSTTMRKKQNGQRIDTLVSLMEKICDVCEVTHGNLKAMRFLNQPVGRTGVKKAHVTNRLKTDYTKWSGLTRIGTELKLKVLDKEVFYGKTLRNRTKPLLIIVITDGEVEGEPPGLLEYVISTCTKVLGNDTNRDQLGRHGVNYLFAYVGNEDEAESFLRRLKNVQEDDFSEVVSCLLDVNLDKAATKDFLKWPLVSKFLLSPFLKRWRAFNLDLAEEGKPQDAGDADADELDEEDVDADA